jgi:hypothetical protein
MPGAEGLVLHGKELSKVPHSGGVFVACYGADIPVS